MKPGPEHILFYIPDNNSSLLDVGCNVGATLLHSHKLGVEKLRGIEINEQAVASAKENTSHLSDCQITHGSADDLPYADEEFMTVTCAEVLEHIPQNLRAKSIAEIHRVLKPGQSLIITFPYKGIFGYLDPANFRMLFPWVYKILVKVLGKGGREQGFEGQKHGVVWHHHFSHNEIEKLFTPYFDIKLKRYRAGLLFPLCEWLLFPIYRLNLTHNLLYKTIKKIQAFDTQLQYGKYFAYDILLVMQKK